MKLKRLNFKVDADLQKPKVIIAGTFHERHKNFIKSSNLTNAVVASCFRIFKSPYLWNENDINHILQLGNSVKDSTVDLNSSSNVGKHEYVKINNKRYLANANYSETVDGQFSKSISLTLLNFFSTSQAGILSCNNKSVALLKEIINDTTEYWMFDSESSSRITAKNVSNGVAVCCSFETLENLTQLLKYNFIERLNASGNSIFKLCPYTIVETVANRRGRNTNALKGKLRIQKLRKNLEYKEAELIGRKTGMKKLRANVQYKVKESICRKAGMRKLRANMQYKNKESISNKAGMKKLRANVQYKVKESICREAGMRKLRANVQYKTKESISNKAGMKKLRANVQYKSKELINRKVGMKKLRANVQYKTKESISNKAGMNKLRANVQYKSKELINRKVGMKKLRANVGYKAKESISRETGMKKLRANVEYKRMELINRKTGMKKLRNNPAFRKRENVSERNRKQEVRKNDDDVRLFEQQCDLQNKRKRRDNDMLGYREHLYNSLVRENTHSAKLQLEFIKIRKSTPSFICCCCEGLFFRHAVIYFDIAKLEKFTDYSKETLASLIINYDSPYICKTCDRYLRMSKLPKLATSNDLKFVDLPDCIRKLSPLEERMAAPYINFMQIRSLKPYALNPQLGLKGSVVNIAVEIGDMLQVLPREFDNMVTIQVKLKRHIEHKADYMYETIRPAIVCDALCYLKDTPLYKEYNIKVDREYLRRHEKQYSENVDFIVDSADLIADNLITTVRSTNVNGFEEIALTTLPEEEVENDEVLVIDGNEDAVNNVQVIAPGQGKKPIPWHMIPHIDELCFPRIFAGHSFNGSLKVSYSDRVKSEIRRRDRRSCVPTRLLFMAKKKLELFCLSQINICMRKTKTTKNVKVGNVLNNEFLANMIKFDDGYKFLRQIRSSPSYWETRKKELLATIRQLGKPTIFLTLSAGETIWPELLQTLAKLLDSKNLSLVEAMNLSSYEKSDLIKRDPVTCARYLDFKISKFMCYLKQKDGPFHEYCVEDSCERVEFQNRGSPHEHILLWLKNAPQYNTEITGNVDNCISFIDRFITCEYNENDPYILVQKHKHTHTCNKGKRNKFKCRFNFPIFVMPLTKILEPLAEEEQNENLKNILTDIKKITQDFYKKPELVEFSVILSKLKITEEQYYRAIRSSLTKTQIFLKRTSLEVGINNYNKDILHLFESNMDIQFVLEEYALASYIINYISKTDAGLSKLLRETASDINNGYTNVREKFRKISNVFLNSNLMCAQEAVYHALSLPLWKNSRKTVFISTFPLQERVKILKSKRELTALNIDSDNVFVDDIFGKYAKRQLSMEDVCLADFASNFSALKTDNQNANEDDDDEVIKDYRRRQKSAIIRYRRYKLIQDPLDFYRENLLLFLPWRNEYSEVENVNCKEIFLNNHRVIEANRKKFQILGDDILDNAMKSAQNNVLEIEEEDVDEFFKGALSEDQQIDILQQGGLEIVKDRGGNHFSCPPRISTKETFELMRELNMRQREFIMHILHCFKTDRLPLRTFLSGSAGVGKSTAINAIYQLITNYFDKLPGSNKGEIFVLLCAPSGKAAFLINGLTLHTAFSLPVSQFAGQMPELSNDIANTLRAKLFHLKLLIIDEISMVGSRLLSRVDTRLRQIMGRNEAFGGISVLVVGDLNQLPPVMDRPVFCSPQSNSLSIFHVELNPLWDEFNYYELTQIMRQRDEVKFIHCLNNLAKGIMSVDDIKLIKSREVDETRVPQSAIRLYGENANVDAYNECRINNAPGEEFVSTAQDIILGKVSEFSKSKVLGALKKKKASELGGLPTYLRIKMEIKYMVTSNIDISDGLVNGSCGILKHISFEPNSKFPSKLWIDFQSHVVGNKVRKAFIGLMNAEGIDSNLTPISKIAYPLTISKDLQYQTMRRQFPLTAAEALTIHKSQGQTYEEVCIDFKKTKRITRQMMYVALSRVKKLSGLYILGSFKPPKSPKVDDKILTEVLRLRQNKPLTFFYDTLNNNDQIKILYHNVGSFPKHLDDIISDSWYSRADILIFSETLSHNYDNIEISGFRIVFHSNAVETRGVLCFVKNHIEVCNLTHVFEHEGKNHVDLFSFQIKDFWVISGYKSPSVGHAMYENCFKKIVSTLSKADGKIVVLGDFNFDVFNCDTGSYFPNLMAKFDLRPILNRNTSTTDHNTQIDVVFSNDDTLIAGVYDSYFSYHKPIYALLSIISSMQSTANLFKESCIIVSEECVNNHTLIPGNENKYIGFINGDGVSCYANSVIQCLIALKDFKRDLLNDIQPEHNVRNSIANIINLVNRGSDNISTRHVRALLSEKTDMNCNANEHQDVHEFLMKLFQCLNEEEPALSAKFSFTRTIVKKCFVCGYSREQSELDSWYFIRFPDPAQSLDFSTFISWDDTDAMCSNCQISYYSEKHIISHVNQYLVLVFSRFASDTGYKLTNSVDNFDEAAVCINETYYDVRAAILHEGQFISSGHYTCIINVNNSWICYDDLKTTKTTFPADLENVYVLVLEKKKGSFALRDVKISIPAAVERGKQAKLRCNYDMEGDPLYAVKWYKGGREFFRYTPLDSPPFKQFPTAHLQVVESMSNKTLVVLDNVSIESSGEFSCEISADAPSFFTMAAIGTLQVVEVPKEGPVIKGLKSRYRLNDTLKAECTSVRSHPAANLTWFVNDYPVDPVHIRRSRAHPSPDGFYSARLGLRLIINKQLFVNGRLRIRCLASMHDIYTRSSEVSVEIEKPKPRMRTTSPPVVEWEAAAAAAERYPHTTLVFAPSTNNNPDSANSVCYKSSLVVFTILFPVLYVLR